MFDEGKGPPGSLFWKGSCKSVLPWWEVETRAGWREARANFEGLASSAECKWVAEGGGSILGAGVSFKLTLAGVKMGILMNWIIRPAQVDDKLVAVELMAIPSLTVYEPSAREMIVCEEHGLAMARCETLAHAQALGPEVVKRASFKAARALMARADFWAIKERTDLLRTLPERVQSVKKDRL